MRRRRTSLSRGIPRDLELLCASGVDSVTFRKELRAKLLRLISFDAYCVNTCDPETLIVSSSVGDGLTAAQSRRLFELEYGGGDLNSLESLARAEQPLVTMFIATNGQVEKSRRMRELFVPMGWRDELRAALKSAKLCWGYLHLFRSTPFTHVECARVEAVRASLGNALRIAAGRKSEAPASQLGVAVLSARSTKVIGSLASLNLDGHQQLPHGVEAVAAHARRSGKSSVRVQKADDSWLTLRGVSTNDAAAVVVDASSPGDVIALKLRSAGLTARQHQVAVLVAEGCSNDAIAVELGLTIHTVKDHLKAVLRKTGSVSRTELLSPSRER